jgi:hypothetical protein
MRNWRTLCIGGTGHRRLRAGTVTIDARARLLAATGHKARRLAAGCARSATFQTAAQFAIQAIGYVGVDRNNAPRTGRGPRATAVTAAGNGCPTPRYSPGDITLSGHLVYRQGQLGRGEVLPLQLLDAFRIPFPNLPGCRRTVRPSMCHVRAVIQHKSAVESYAICERTKNIRPWGDKSGGRARELRRRA